MALNEAKMRKPRVKKYYAPQSEAHEQHVCDYPGCTKKGEFRAPKDRKLREYYWFCLDHVQEYNAKWNYFEGISTEAPEEEEKKRMHFRGFRSKVKYSRGYNFFDDFEFFDEYHSDYSAADEIYYSETEKRYLQIMEIKPGELNAENLKKQYKKLVKKYHPDLNQDDKKAAEEKFKQLVQAYQQLMRRFG